MKNNKGFIATTLIYSFLLLFATLIVVIIGNYNYYRNTLSKYNKGINDALNDKITLKYVNLHNEIDNSDLEKNKKVDASYTDPWSFSTPYIGIDYGNLSIIKYPYTSSGTGVTYSDTTKRDGKYSLKFDYESMGRTVTALSNSFKCQSGHYYYVSYYVFTNGTITGKIHDTSKFPPKFKDYGKIGLFYSGALGETGTNVVYENLTFDFQNWNKRGILGKATGTADCQFRVNYINNESTLMYIDDVVVTDVTDIIKASGLLVNGTISDANLTKIKEIFNSDTKAGRIDYFADNTIYNTDNLLSDLN